MTVADGWASLTLPSEAGLGGPGSLTRWRLEVEAPGAAEAPRRATRRRWGDGGSQAPGGQPGGRDDAVVDAIDDIIDALQVEPDERAAFVEASRSFLRVMAGWSAEHDRGDWPPLATLVALERELLTYVIEPDDVWVDRAAAVKTVRDALAREERAKLN